MPEQPSLTSLALLLGLSFFFGLAFEEFYGRSGETRPGGIRTFPLLAIAGGMLYLLEPTHLTAFIAGLLVLGALLLVYYRDRLNSRDELSEAGATLMVPICNVHAYLLGPIALALPHWLAVAVTVTSVLLFTGRERLHALARQVQVSEIVTAGQFLILTGIVLPLLPNEPVTTLTSITPRQAWLALLAVCTVSYAIYLVERLLAPKEGDLWMAMLGGAYSSTATTVVLARRARTEPAAAAGTRAGITLATAVMYLRILIIVAVFNLALARELAVPLVGLSLLAMVWAWAQYRRAKPEGTGKAQPYAPGNPLALPTAAIFAILYVLISLLSSWVAGEFGRFGIFALAAVVGVADIDPFVLNLAQGGTASLGPVSLAAAILIAISSNNLLKAGYTVAFAGWRGSLPTVGALAALSILGVAIAALASIG
ncbi:MAG TPA: DUF4010 domain-containing protein [Stellaceae bacterium]|nr:DUF4010 domain-containing protein [Stellaceae bacterium]